MQLKNRNAKMFVWNTIGSMCSAGTSFILLIFVTRICGSKEAGIFALGFANAQLMLTIGRFGMRAYQATDIKASIQFQTYFTSRLITCSLMLLVGLAYIIWRNDSFTKSAILFSICSIKMVDALEDVFHGLLQQKGYMDVAGQYLTIRNITTIVSFITLLLFSKDLLLTCILTGAISIGVCLCLNMPRVGKMEHISIFCSKKELYSLFLNCLPLFIGTFLTLYIYNIPKYTIDHYLTSDMQTYYNILFMPAFVINLFSEFMFKPLLTDLAGIWIRSEIKMFVRYALRLMLGILLLTTVVVGGGAFLGNEILSMIYGVNLMQYRSELILLLISGGFSACVYFLFHALTAMRKQMILLTGYSFVALVSSLFTPLLVQRFSIMGASVASFISSALLFLFFSIMLIEAIVKKRKTQS